ncbi:MAG: hypothetical protein IJE05_02030 [Clostridia bacterium]|nr:hypothetical protein [Clostridia bacterium]
MNMENITTMIISLTAFITAIGTLIVTIMKAKKEIEDTLPKKIQKQCSINIEITNRLEQVKEYLMADRVQIYDFHNGGHYANGRSALKTSCSYEVVRIGVKGHQKELQAVPLTCIPKFVRTLLNQNELIVNDLEEIRDVMPATYQLKKEQDIMSFYDIILNNKQGEPIRFSSNSVW